MINRSFKIFLIATSIIFSSTFSAFSQSSTVLQLARETESLSTFVEVLEEAGLPEDLDEEGPITIFAPSDRALAALPKGTLDDLLKPVNHDKLVEIVKYHMVAGKIPSSEIAHNNDLASLQGSSINFQVDGLEIIADGATLQETNLPASDGIIHIIDRLILPEKL